MQRTCLAPGRSVEMKKTVSDNWRLTRAEIGRCAGRRRACALRTGRSLRLRRRRCLVIRREREHRCLSPAKGSKARRPNFAFDGLIELRVKQVRGSQVICDVVNGGALGEKQRNQFAGVKLPRSGG